MNKETSMVAALGCGGLLAYSYFGDIDTLFRVALSFLSGLGTTYIYLKLI